ncbi:conserved protein of unknown function [Tenacibaculum sp. 190130A14a]|uniref:Metal-dependent HD superfamily phosphohydrolase n=1 Tax=Tenacibaculum polynesiense TaxID=3137857 RepID=A0ABM9PAG7_9FLAO
MDLENRFFRLLEKYTTNKAHIQKLWTNLHQKYSESHRAYHNLTHLKELFSYFDEYQEHLENSDIVAFSIFYHDVIYNIWNKDNEEKSADFALLELERILSKSSLESIYRQIIATKTHQASDNDTQFLVDFDLTILGKSSAVYTNYTKLIRKEYQLVPRFMYKKGRKKVLQHFLDKEAIYGSKTFNDLFEKQARINLTNELNNL